MQSQLKEVLPKQSSFSDFEVKHAFPEIGTRVMLLNARKIDQDANESGAILLAFEDITVRREHEEAAGRVFAETTRELDRTKEELRKLASNLMNVREEEDRLIARELHDDFSQRLAFLIITLEQFRLGILGQKYPELSEPFAAFQPGLNGLEAARRIKQVCPIILLIFVSEHNEKSYREAAFDAGGSGYVTKKEMMADLVPAIRDVLIGKEYGRFTA